MYSDDHNKAPLHHDFWWDSLRIGKRCSWLAVAGLQESTTALSKDWASLHLDYRRASTLKATGEASKTHTVQLLGPTFSQSYEGHDGQLGMIDFFRSA